MFALFSIGMFGMYFILSYFLDVVLFSKVEERINYLKYIADTMFDSVKSATELFDKEEIK